MPIYSECGLTNRDPSLVNKRTESVGKAQDLLHRSQQEFEAGNLAGAKELLSRALVGNPLLLLREHMPVDIPVTVGPHTIEDVLSSCRNQPPRHH